MDIVKHRLAIAITFALALPLSSIGHASTVNVLYPSPASNDNIAVGNYQIGGAHAPEQSFLDDFKFSLASANFVNINLVNLVSSDTAPTPSPSGSNYLIDNKFLTFSLFDHLGNYLGSGGAGHELNMVNLVSGEMYTLTVSGKASGIFGGQYKGDIGVGVEAPLGATLPMFSAALLTLCIRRKKQIG